MMQILGYFEPYRDLTKLLKYVLPKVLLLCKTLLFFFGKLTLFFDYYHYTVVVLCCIFLTRY